MKADDPAFPQSGGHYLPEQKGISIRALLAAMMAPKIAEMVNLSSKESVHDAAKKLGAGTELNLTAKISVKLADALIAELNEP